MKFEGFNPNNTTKEPGLEEASNKMSMEQNTLVLDNIGKKILALRQEQEAIAQEPEIAAYLKKSQERVAAREKSSEFQQSIENKLEKNKDADNLAESIQNLRNSEETENQIIDQLQEIESKMSKEMISGLQRMAEIDEEIINLESQIEDVDLQQTSGGLNEVDGFSLN